MESFILTALIIIPSVIIASTIHEFAHAFVAYKLGDPTAKLEGRLTLNPISHIDPIGLLTMIVSGGRFGWSKPVPTNENNYNIEPRLGTALVAIAGPFSNILTALFFSLIFRITYPFLNEFILVIMLMFIAINLSLVIFNFLPIPPLDGSRVVRAILPPRLLEFWEDFERYVPFVFIFLFFTPITPIGTFMREFMGNILNALLVLFTGVSFY